MPLPFPSMDLSVPPSHHGPKRKLLERVQNTDDYILQIDWSSIESATTCDRSALWKLVHSRIAQPCYALTYGKAIHKGLEMMYQHLRAQQTGMLNDVDTLPLPTILSECERIFIEQPPPALEWRSFATFSHAMTQYATRELPKDKDQFRVLHVEQPFALDLGTITVGNYLTIAPSLILADPGDYTDFNQMYVERIHVRWMGVIDLVLDDAGEIWIADHKTSSIEGESFWEAFTLSQQMMGYTWAGRKILQKDVKGAIVNAIIGRKPTKTGKSLEFGRHRYYYTSAQLDEWQSNMLTIISDLIHHLVTGDFPMKTQWCFGKYGKCPYHDVCSMPKEARLMMLDTSQYTDNTWNPLES